MNKEKFSIRIKALIKDKGIKQKELAEHLGTTEKAVSEWVKGKKTPRYYHLEELADYFDTSIQYLTGRTDSKIDWKKYDVQHQSEISEIKGELSLINYIEFLGYDLSQLSEDTYLQFEKEIKEFIEFKISKLLERKEPII